MLIMQGTLSLKDFSISCPAVLLTSTPFAITMKTQIFSSPFKKRQFTQAQIKSIY